MPATPLATSTRFMQAGVTVVYYLPAVAAATKIPTRAEIDAGTNLTAEIADLSGWMVEGNDIDTPDMASEFTAKIPGRTAAADSSLTFYGDQTGLDVRDLLPRGTEGFVMFCDGGDVVGQPADVFPIRVKAAPKQRSVGEEAHRIVVQCSVTSEPAEDVAIPA